MIVDLKQAAAKAQNLGKQLQSVIDVGNCLDELGNLELARKEALTGLEKAQAEYAAAQHDLQGIRGEITRAKAALTLSEEAAVKTLDDVNTARQTLLAQARAQGKEIVESATKSANEQIAQLNSEIGHLSKKHQRLTDEVEKETKAVQILRYEMRELAERLGIE